MMLTSDNVEEEKCITPFILKNVLASATEAGLTHIVAINESDASIMPMLKESGIPFTCLQPVG